MKLKIVGLLLVVMCGQMRADFFPKNSSGLVNFLSVEEFERQLHAGEKITPIELEMIKFGLKIAPSEKNLATQLLRAYKDLLIKYGQWKD